MTHWFVTRRPWCFLWTWTTKKFDTFLLGGTLWDSIIERPPDPISTLSREGRSLLYHFFPNIALASMSSFSVSESSSLFCQVSDDQMRRAGIPDACFRNSSNKIWTIHYSTHLSTIDVYLWRPNVECRLDWATGDQIDLCANKIKSKRNYTNLRSLAYTTLFCSYCKYPKRLEIYRQIWTTIVL